MENDRKRWVNFSYLVVSGLLFYVSAGFFDFLVAKFDLEARTRNADMYSRGTAIALGVICFVSLLRNTKANAFMDEVVLELSRVTWPTQQETVRATGVVIVMVLIAGFILGALDGFWHWALKFVI